MYKNGAIALLITHMQPESCPFSVGHNLFTKIIIIDNDFIIYSSESWAKEPWLKFVNICSTTCPLNVVIKTLAGSFGGI